MAGVGLLYFMHRPLNMTQLTKHPMGLEGWEGMAFVLLLIGGLAKAGAMPFHSWIPDAAVDAPMPFMALVPASIEKFLGIYVTARVSVDLFKGVGGSWAGTLMMTVGVVTIILAVLMALVQKDFKRLLSFHAISQVGYMVLGLGTGTAIGVLGGLLHMVNHCMYKSTLFLTGGSVELQTGTTDLRKISGLGKQMPITMACFVVAALSISGFPLTNGFYSKELVYHAALERGLVFYLIAAGGSILTAASFLKLGHAAFFGPYKVPKKVEGVRDPSWLMVAPMATIAILCLIFGLGNAIPIDLMIRPGLSHHMASELADASGPVPHNWALVGGTVLCLAIAAANHAWGFKRTGSGLAAADHIHYAPVAHQLYDAAERRWFDPYEIARKIIRVLAHIGFALDRAIDFIYMRVVTTIAILASRFLRAAHSGNFAWYLVWVVVGVEFIIIIFARGI
jgi:NADH-quinone oxidoreductase subunit L